MGYIKTQSLVFFHQKFSFFDFYICFLKKSTYQFPRLSSLFDPFFWNGFFFGFFIPTYTVLLPCLYCGCGLFSFPTKQTVAGLPHFRGALIGLQNLQCAWFPIAVYFFRVCALSPTPPNQRFYPHFLLGAPFIYPTSFANENNPRRLGFVSPFQLQRFLFSSPEFLPFFCFPDFIPPIDVPI